jgi:hypothetical protein
VRGLKVAIFIVGYEETFSQMKRKSERERGEKGMEKGLDRLSFGGL